MQTIRLKRTGKHELVFTGEQIATVNDQKDYQGSTVNLQLTLYRASLGVYILSITLEKNFNSSQSILHGAVSFADIKDINDFLLSEEGRGIAELLLLLLEQASELRQSSASESRRIIPNFTSGINEPALSEADATV
ncbi:MAG: hypothetical protein ACOCV7_04110 [Desulfonatronovibrionaceae bacterium]